MAKPNPTAPALKHADGTAVTAQEAYDAFMNTRVLIVKSGTTYEAINMMWYDNNSAQTDPANVGFVRLCFMEDVSGVATISYRTVGNSSLVPKQQK